MSNEDVFHALAYRADDLLAAKTRRDNAIRDAGAAGYSLRQIATEVQLSHEQVRQIIGGRDSGRNEK